MDALTAKILARIYRDDTAFSRNKNFEAYRDPRVQYAARLCRHLKDLEEDLLAHGSQDTVTMHAGEPPPNDGAVRIRVTIHALNCRRTTFLSRTELDLLRENPALAPLLSTAP